MSKSVKKGDKESMKVKNLNGTSMSKPEECESWKEFYVKRHGYWPISCSCLGCSRSADVGAHVKKVGSYDGRWYIAALWNLRWDAKIKFPLQNL